jgi:hypothetical protein
MEVGKALEKSPPAKRRKNRILNEISGLGLRSDMMTVLEGSLALLKGNLALLKGSLALKKKLFYSKN